MAKTMTGIVASNKTDKTITVLVVTHKTHPIYKKQYISSKKFMAHDEKNEANEGDKVRIVEVRPISARKRFSLDKVIETAGITHSEAAPQLPEKDVKPNAPKKSAKKELLEDSKPSKENDK